MAMKDNQDIAAYYEKLLHKHKDGPLAANPDNDAIREQLFYTLAPFDHQALRAVAEALLDQGRTRDAEAALRDVLLEDPKHEQARALLAELGASAFS